MHIRGIEFCEATGVPYFVIHGIAAEDSARERLNMRLYEPLAAFLRGKTNRMFDLDPELVLPCLTVIRKTGESIRKLIAGGTAAVTML